MAQWFDCGKLETENSSWESNRHVEAAMQVEEKAKIEQGEFGFGNRRCDIRLQKMQPRGEFQEEALQAPEAFR